MLCSSAIFFSVCSAQKQTLHFGTCKTESPNTVEQSSIPAIIQLMVEKELPWALI